MIYKISNSIEESILLYTKAVERLKWGKFDLKFCVYKTTGYSKIEYFKLLTLLLDIQNIILILGPLHIEAPLTATYN